MIGEGVGNRCKSGCVSGGGGNRAESPFWSGGRKGGKLLKRSGEF